MNPYAKYLEGKNPQEVIEATPKVLASLTDRLETEALERSYAPGKWSARHILCHLADTELAFAFRIRQALAEDHHVIQPFDQELWAKSYGSLNARAAVETFSAVRRWNLALIKTVPGDAYAKPLRHPERGDMAFQTLIETMAGHDLNHLHQLEAIGSHAA